MGFYELPYPNAYEKKNNHYTFVDPVDGKEYRYVAGQDGIDEHWIEIIKEEDRKLNASDRKFARPRKAPNDDMYGRTVVSLDEIDPETIEATDILIDPNSDSEAAFIRKMDERAFRIEYNRAISMLKVMPYRIWRLYAEEGFTAAEIALMVGISEKAVRRSIDRIRKRIIKILRKSGAF